jgi:hypothetical protein
MITEELRALIEAGGLTPDHLALNQMAKAVQAGGYRKAVAAGTADAITATFTPAISALSDGMVLYVRAGFANATSTPTFTPASGTIAAKTIVKGAGTALAAGDIAGAGHWLALQYDSTLDKWLLINPATGIGTVTAATDPTFANNSGSPASTSWVRGAMLAIAQAAGFAVNYSQSGYIKFPSWLGGWIVQWGVATAAGETSAVVTLPITFPNAFIGVQATLYGTAPIGNAVASTYAGIANTSQFTVVNDQYVGSPSNSIYWLAYGY